MPNVGFGFATLLGLLDIPLALIYLIASITIPVRLRATMQTIEVILFLIQAVIAPMFLFLVGVILVFQGWRLDPVMQFAMLLLHGLVIYFGVKDIVMYRDR